MIKLYDKVLKERPDYVVLVKRGIFNYLLHDQAKEFSQKLGLKLKIEKEISSSGEEFEHASCGFPDSGLDKYIGKLVRLGKNVVLCGSEGIKEEIEVKPQ